MIDGKISQANGRLSLGKVGVSIERIGERLYLRATFPPKPRASRSDPHQQRLALGVHANPAGVSHAEKLARKIGADLDCGAFSWEDHPARVQKKTDISALQNLLSDFEKSVRSSVSETTWRTEYQRVFGRLAAGGSELTAELIERTILQTEPDSRQRRRFCVSLGRLAEFAGLTVDTRRLRGKYSASALEPRSLPSDQQILEYGMAINNNSWRWVYFMMAAYGLRNHEAFFLDTEIMQSGGYQIRVLSGKTGARNVWPFPADWVDLYDLRAPRLPAVSGKTHSDYGNRVTQYFRRNLALPFHPYDLRHCWAVRTLGLGLDLSLAAQQMGHSLKVHSETYHRWISDEIHQQAFNQIQQRDGGGAAAAALAETVMCGDDR